MERTAVAEGADWFVSSHDELREVLAKHNVAFVGSGARPWVRVVLSVVGFGIGSD